MRRLLNRGLFSVSAAALLALALAACGGTATTSPTAPTVTTTTTAFTGTLAQSGIADHSFPVATAGTVTVTLTAVAPLATMAIGVGIGTWDGLTCNALNAQNANARTGTAALTGTATAGNYCIRVYDSGNIPAGWNVDYTVEVVHP